ncbi:DUF6480 family protein [Streptomyces sp. SP17BM10]|uniref:DUF6480 family protein n=1 Tax=Streptomyces sp. SP17BM10 TaxID=3002530 RepID=UPI002E77A75C|nr:DUF6480 family protein [Streptomyces sp. SP17BM10]MEE1787085.1 DUF6480 family protein [Streptomyces sp. SP17BM10]
MTTPDPDPERTPALDERGTLPGGDTPPAEGGISGISHPEPEELRTAWGIWPAVVIVVLALAVSVMLVAMIFVLT